MLAHIKFWKIVSRGSVLCLLTVVASGSPTTKPTAEIYWGEAFKGCRIGIENNDVESNAGEPIDEIVTIQNVSDHDITIYKDMDRPYTPFLISATNVKYSFDVAKTKFALRRSGFASGVRMDLKPGHSFKVKMRINRVLDLSVAGNYVAEVSVVLGLDREDKEIKAVSVPFKLHIVDSDSD